MDNKDFDNLIESVKQAGEIKHTDPSGRQLARDNLDTLLKEARIDKDKVIVMEIPGNIHGQVWSAGATYSLFTIQRGDALCYVEMPRLPLEQVRWVGNESGPIYGFPRLYIGGSSWVWKYAVSSLIDELSPRRNE